MSAEVKKSYGSTVTLCFLGLLAVYGGPSWLLVLVPAAVLVWYVARPVSRQQNSQPLTPGAK